MSELGRSWTDGLNFRPARDVEIKYGNGLLERESSEWPSYIVVTTKSSGEDAKSLLASQPSKTGIVSSLDWGHLEETTNSLPDDADLVVGIGGGTALDASKYVALRKDLPLRLVPTIVSTGAIIHGMFAKWEGRSTVGKVTEWPYCDFEYVIVDYDLVLKSPWYLNTAGIGDVLCMWSDFDEWRVMADLSKFPKADEQLISAPTAHLKELVEKFPETLNNQGGLTAESVKFIMQSIHERDDRQVKSPYMTGAGHMMTQAIESILNRGGLIHGEMAALGAVIVEFACDKDTDEIERMLRVCKVRYLPNDLGITNEEFLYVLKNLSKFYSNRGSQSILNERPLSDEKINQLCHKLGVKL